MFFRVEVPGFGSFFVEAGDPGLAVSAVQQFLNRNQIRLEEGSGVSDAVEVPRDQVAGDLILNSAGFPTELQPPPPPAEAPQGPDAAGRDASRRRGVVTQSASDCWIAAASFSDQS